MSDLYSPECVARSKFCMIRKSYKHLYRVVVTTNVQNMWGLIFVIKADTTLAFCDARALVAQNTTHKAMMYTALQAQANGTYIT